MCKGNTALSNCSKTMKGQIWKWIDPIFGNKDASGPSELVQHEAMMRFSRMVVVLESAEHTGSFASVLVAPITSNSEHFDPSRFSVKVDINGGKDSLIVINKIFPASLNSLEFYIATLTSEKLKEVDEALAKLFQHPSTPVPKTAQPSVPQLDDEDIVRSNITYNRKSLDDVFDDSEQEMLNRMIERANSDDIISRRRYYTREEKRIFCIYCLMVNQDFVDIAKTFDLNRSTVTNRISRWRKEFSL